MSTPIPPQPQFDSLPSGAQRKASHAKNLFIEDRLLRATDVVVRRRREDRYDPDLPDRIDECDIAAAVEGTEDEADGLVRQLMVASENLITRAIENTRRTVRRRHAVHCAMPPQELAAPDRRAERRRSPGFRIAC